MNILVCMKQVVEIETARMTDDYSIDRAKSKPAVNPADCAALEHALLLKEKHGGTITVLTMGPQSAADQLREVAAFAVDRLVHLSDPLVAGSDTLVTARVLAAAISHLGSFDLILAGRRAVDGETGHVPAEIAAFLEIPCVTNVVSIEGSDGTKSLAPRGGEEDVNYAMPDEEQDMEEFAKAAFLANSLQCQRLLEDGMITLRVPMPCILSVCGGATELRPPSIEGMRRAKEAEIRTMTTKDLEIDPATLGRAGSPTTVRRLVDPEVPAREKVQCTDVAEGAGKIMESLRSVETLARKQMTIEQVKEGRSRKPYGTHAVLIIETERASVVAGLELLTRAVRTGINPICILVGPGSPEAENAIVRAGASELDLLHTPEEADDRFLAEAIATHLRRLEDDERPLTSIVLGATVRGRAIAPMCGALLSLGVTADCTAIDYLEAGSLLQVRPTFGGTKLAEIVTTTRPQLATVRPGIYADRTGLVSPSFGGTIMRVHPVKGAGEIKVLDMVRGQSSQLAEADVVLAGGRDIGEEGFALLMQIRELLEDLYEGEFKVAVGASRAAVDSGAIPYFAQVGMTGQVVHPQVYVAFPIEGAVQHLAGMKNADTIIAVNKDRKAHIFDHADLGLVCDWHETAEALLALLQKAKAEKK